MKVNKTPTMWTSKNHSLVTILSGKAVHVARSYCEKFVTWPRSFLLELNKETVLEHNPYICPTTMLLDSSNALVIEEILIVSKKTSVLL